VHEILDGLPNLSLLEPLDYLSMVQLMKRAAVILTDSGGIQEEAPSLGVPVLVMRDTTERPEGVDAGLVRLVGTDRRRIVGETKRVLEGRAQMKTALPGQSPYGDGKAAARIVSVLLGGR
jgi:UDP-N-acetylglucosamine 2-epimerase